MLQQYLTENGISVYSLAKACHIPYSTLNDLVNGKVELDNCRLGLVRALAAELGFTIDEFCIRFSRSERVYRNKYDVNVLLSVRGKTYHALFEYMGESVDLPLCKVNDDSTFYIEDILKWRSEEYIRDRRMSTWNTI